MESEQTLFCLSEISDSKRYLETIAPQLLKLRLQYEKYKGSGLKAEQDSLSELSKTVKKILRHFPYLIQQLSELGDSATLETTEKMYSVLKKYDYLGVSDYTPLCKALLVFASKLPSREGNINKAALGHLMNQVRIGYFPTDKESLTLTEVFERYDKWRDANRFQPMKRTTFRKRLEALKYKVWKSGTTVVGIGQNIDENTPF